MQKNKNYRDQRSVNIFAKGQIAIMLGFVFQAIPIATNSILAIVVRKQPYTSEIERE